MQLRAYIRIGLYIAFPPAGEFAEAATEFVIFPGSGGVGRQIERLERLSQEADLDPAFAKKFLNFIISEVIRHHEKLQK